MTLPTFSIATVTLNPGKDLDVTAASIVAQSFESYEWVVKDGGSEPGQLQALEKGPPSRLRLFQSPDRGIFDAMNQSLHLCTGEYVIFMNAGDGFYDPTILAKIAEAMAREPNDLYYCDYYNSKWKTVIRYPQALTKKYLYRRVPCHQGVVARRSVLLDGGGFRGDEFKIVADHEMMYRMVFKRNIVPKHLALTCCTYKDDGTHASKAGFARREKERRNLRAEYFSRAERLTWGAMYHATLPGLRTWITLKCRGGRFSKSYLWVMARASALMNR
jgi:glycosyltransferase involved in cell wall biosynthesis